MNWIISNWTETSLFEKLLITGVSVSTAAFGGLTIVPNIMISDSGSEAAKNTSIYALYVGSGGLIVGGLLGVVTMNPNPPLIGIGGLLSVIPYGIIQKIVRL
jgi:hypothetical protein